MRRSAQFSLGDIAFHCYEVGELPRLIANRLNLDCRPVLASRLAVIEQLTPKSQARADSFPHHRDRGRIAFRSLEQRARLATEHFFG